MPFVTSRAGVWIAKNVETRTVSHGRALSTTAEEARVAEGGRAISRVDLIYAYEEGMFLLDAFERRSAEQREAKSELAARWHVFGHSRYDGARWQFRPPTCPATERYTSE